ncbi:Uncharacterised protein [Mycolicibacterium vanbaalenii]|uniref:Secreted protein n=1 Tax=Mycolicibacterium vanbaalenii TaxID=110539 RepID=A0A5S9RAU0_MYCVN|nr:hypothetical protein [Mycolicibacterium vanbaalenii]CAA0136346.1 Uncharacterised protein [Mycolicibacterium vanbaalenii]
MLTIHRALFASGLVLGAAFGVPAGGVLVASAQAAPVVQEDDPGWDCRTMGDRVCGPTNAQGVAAGLYRDGALVSAWDPAWYGHPELVPAS